MRKILLSVTALSAAALAATPLVAQEDSGKRFVVALEGAQEVGNSGDPDGSGTATLRINAGQEQVCYSISVSGIAPATMAHIHIGAAGTNGPVRVNLAPPSNGSSSGCANVSRELALALIRNPENYYVNVHNAEFPTGALRGQIAF